MRVLKILKGSLGISSPHLGDLGRVNLDRQKSPTPLHVRSPEPVRKLQEVSDSVIRPLLSRLLGYPLGLSVEFLLQPAEITCRRLDALRCKASLDLDVHPSPRV